MRSSVTQDCMVTQEMTKEDKGKLFILFVVLFTLSLLSKIVCSLWLNLLFGGVLVASCLSSLKNVERRFVEAITWLQQGKNESRLKP